MYHGTPRGSAPLLERQLLFISSLFDVVPLERIAESPGRRRRVVLTFDDGLRTNITVAYPLLKKLALPATFYICPELVDKRRWLWNHEMRARLGTMERTAFIALADHLGAPRERELFITWMKGLDLASRRPAEQAVRRATRYFVASSAQHEAYDLATWDELAALDPSVVTVGSHTLTHSILTSLSPAEMQREIAESRQRIEERLQRPADHFCYPNGDVDAAILELTRRHYKTAATTVPGRAFPGFDAHFLPRWPCATSLTHLARILYPWPRALLGRLGERTIGRFAARVRTLSWMVSKA
jgi:peptidoglycan/xylan/chitin deacetylase (PgdA/CDA1 family)